MSGTSGSGTAAFVTTLASLSTDLTRSMSGIYEKFDVEKTELIVQLKAELVLERKRLIESEKQILLVTREVPSHTISM